MSHTPHASGEVHSHVGLYLKTGAALTLLTAIEIGALFVPGIKPLLPPALIAMAVVKFALVIGMFMHLRDDKPIFRGLFLVPLVLACGSFLAMSLLAIVHYEPFGVGYIVTALQKAEGFVPPSTAAPAEPAWPEDKLQAAFAESAKTGHEKGKATFAASCVSCHRADGGGMPGLGPNMTDNCYKHGGKLGELYNTISTGVAGTAMPPWGASMKGEQMRDVMYYIRSLRGTNVAGGKPCEGTPVTD